MPRSELRFGVSSNQAASAAEWRAKARRIEELGYSTLLVPDHLGPQIGALPALAFAAAATERLRIGTFVLDNDFRHPAVLAKEAATLDLLSGGRLELGLGAGWMKRDYDASGIPFDRPGLRIARLAESLQVLRGLWSDSTFSFDGEHVTIRDLDGMPKPLQRPGPPLFVGGGGPRMLELAARRADIVGLIPRSRTDGSGLDPGDLLGDGLARKVDTVERAAGDRFAGIELNLLIQRVEVTDDAGPVLERIAREWSLTAEEASRMPIVLVGRAEEIAGRLRELHATYGISYFTVYGDAFERFAPVVELLADP